MIPDLRQTWARVVCDNQAASKGDYGRANLIIGGRGDRRRASMEERFGALADALLVSEGIVTDAASRWAPIEELERSLTQSAKKLHRNAEGDYAPDLDAAKFPEWKREERTSSSRSSSSTIDSVFDGWKLEAVAAHRSPKTIKEYRSVVERFARFLGHQDPRRVSPSDVLRWKDKRIADGCAAKTVKDSDLSALKSGFGWAERNGVISSNPAGA
jgi:Phage integrase, N-terminal SAM-like domain